MPFVAASLAQSRERYSKSIGEARLMVGNCIRMMCRAPKSRAGCHFAAAIGLRSMLEDFAPTIPDWAIDQHTLKGKAMGRGLDHFRSEGAKLVPPPTGRDPYEDEAYRLWAIKQRGKERRGRSRRERTQTFASVQPVPRAETTRMPRNGHSRGPCS